MHAVETPHDAKPAILVVEDSQQQRESLATQIERLGYECALATTCAESLALIQTGRFACCLVDIGLPDGRGVDLLEEFHLADPDMVAVMLTGEQNPDTVIEAMRGGAFDYLIKPVDFITLRAGLQRALTHHNLLRERAELVALLRTERDRLRTRIEEATLDVRSHAKECETSNALLHTLLEIAKLSEAHQSDEALIEAVLKRMLQHVPIVCLAMCDLQRSEFVGAIRDERGAIDTIRAGIDGSGWGSTFSPTESDLLTSYWVRRHTGLVTASYASAVYPYGEKARPHHTVGFYLDLGFTPNSSEEEFLATCAHFVAYECQRYRLMLHAAQQASLGNIALELSRSFLQSLTAIRTAADFLTESLTSEDDRDGMAIISRNAEWLASQVRRFNGLAQPREDSVETVELSKFIEQSLGLLSGSIENRGVRIHTDFKAESTCVLLNGAALARTFLDLISCAVRTVKRGATIEISIDETDTSQVVCSIMHSAAAGQVFNVMGGEAFQNTLPASKDHPTYALAQRTVQSCGGKLTLEARDGGVNVFRILLPRNAIEGQTLAGAPA